VLGEGNLRTEGEIDSPTEELWDELSYLEGGSDKRKEDDPG